MLLTWFVYVAVFNFSPVDVLSQSLSTNKRSDELIPCDDGWFLFREKCLKLHGGAWKTKDILQWEKAEARCKKDGGNLVSIHSKEELDFVTYFLLVNVKVAAWIGLRRPSNSTFSWSDGSALTYTNWKSGQPSKTDKEKCVAMLYDPAVDSVGQWDDIPCNSKWYGYICQKKSNRRKRSQNPQFCSAEQGGGWKFEHTCYHFVMEKKTWDTAEQHCQDNYGGHLATILHKGIDLYLNNLLSGLKDQFWIGMKITNELQQKWISGWFVAYNRTLAQYPDIDTCVVRKSSTTWETVPCSNKYSFICDTMEDPPVLNPPVEGSHCPKIPSDWIDLGGEYCYFFETAKTANWYEALYECKRRGGELVSIHSKDESELMQPFVKYVTSMGYYIGLLRLLGSEDAFAWSDRSPMDYKHWSFWEPNNEDEKCGELWPYIMDWNDVWCSEKRGYICSVRKVMPNRTVTPEAIACNSIHTAEVISGK